MKKAFINALFLAFQNFANSQTVANEHCNDGCPKVCNMPILYPYEHSADSVVTYIHIGVGLCIARSDYCGQCEGLETRDG